MSNTLAEPKTTKRQAETLAYREHPSRAATELVYLIGQSRKFEYIYVRAALRAAIGEGSFANGLLADLDGRTVRLFFVRYGRSQAHHYKAYAKFDSDWSPVKTVDLHRITNARLNNIGLQAA